jgi:hypothetical protein
MSTVYPTTESRAVRAVQAGGATESVGGLAVVVLAILAIVGVAPRFLGPIAGIIFGAAFILEGGVVVARQSTAAGASVEEAGGVSLELLAGLAAIVLGVLALIGVAIPVLMGSLVIEGGAAFILSAGLIGSAALAGPPDAVTAASTSAMSAHVLAGLAAIVLGIISFTSPAINPMLTEVALLVLGGTLALNGTAVSTTMSRLFPRQG